MPEDVALNDGLRSQFRCPHCGSWEQTVTDSRGNTKGTRVRRRHACRECGKRFTSYAYLDIDDDNIRQWERDSLMLKRLKAVLDLPIE